jgi:hypothetical protein
MHWIIIFLFASFWTAVYSQTWNGTYNVDSTCNVDDCCCLSNQIIITGSTSNSFAFNTSLNGMCLGETSYSGEFADPIGYTVTLTISTVTLTITLTITLSNDSSTLTVTNSLGSSCGVEAIRQGTIVETSTIHSNAVRLYVHIIMLCSLTFFSIVMSI